MLFQIIDRVVVECLGALKKSFSLPPVRDRVVEMAAKIVIEPIFGTIMDLLDAGGQLDFICQQVTAARREGCLSASEGRPAITNGWQTRVARRSPSAGIGLLDSTVSDTGPPRAVGSAIGASDDAERPRHLAASTRNPFLNWTDP